MPDRHDTQLHRSLDASGDPITTGWARLADGIGGEVWGAPGSGVGGSLPWFVVTDGAYGAVGDGTTDDTAAINAAIAALVAAGGGVLYFPATPDYYKCTAALTAISVPGLVLGDGSTGSYDGATLTASKIVCTSGTAEFMEISAGVSVRGISLVNTAGSVTAGYGIGGTDMNICRLEDVSVVGFWINYGMDGGLWSLTKCYGRQAHKYSVDATYAAVPDGGDWNITDSYFVDGANGSDAAIHVVSGGGKIIGCKVNSNGAGLGYGIEAHIPNGVAVSDLLITGNSIEGFNADGIRLETAAGGSFDRITIVGNQIGQDMSYNTTGNGISIVADTLGDLTGVLIDANELQPFGGSSTGYGVKLTNADRVVLGTTLVGIASGGYADLLSQSGSIVVDYTGGIAGSVSITGTPSVGDVPIASSPTTAAWGPSSAGGIWRPVMATDGTDWWVVVDGDGTAVMAFS